MTLHLIKLSAGCKAPEQLAQWQAERRRLSGQVYHDTRMMPRRRTALLAGGSIYWVIGGQVRLRQGLLDIERRHDPEGRGFARLILDPVLVPTRPRPQRAFQGWRYLAAEAAPADSPAGSAQSGLPPALEAELAALGLL